MSFFIFIILSSVKTRAQDCPAILAEIKMQHGIIAGVSPGGVQTGFADSPLCQQRLCFSGSQGRFRMGKDTALFPECKSADTVFAEIPLGMLRDCRAAFWAAARSSSFLAPTSA